MEETNPIKPITINLKDSSNAKRFDAENLIHQIEFEKVKKWIDAKIDVARQFKSNRDQKVRLHDTITILGSRGSGKTTFLLSLLDEYDPKDKDDKCERKRKDSEVEVIDIIDPTLIEEKGHIFLTVISQIAERVEKKLSSIDCDPESKDVHKKNEWRRKLKSLASGIPSMDGVEGDMGDKWQDPEFIMDNGLKRVQSAKSLEKDFHNLVEYALDILDKKVFIITLDDIDIDFLKGWSVLEMIRKYLTSPLIITILSGDLELFSKAIRKKQWKNFGKALLVNEGQELGNLNDYNDLVTEMEGQYLQKVMQPQKRIHLTTLLEKINLYGPSITIEDKAAETEHDDEKTMTVPFIQIKKDKQSAGISVINHYDHVLKKFGIQNKYQAEAYRSFLLSLPIRTQIQFLSAFEDNDDIRHVNVTDPFLSDLYEKRVDVDSVQSSIKFLNVNVLDLLIRGRVLDEAYQLQPTTKDVSLNSSMISLSFEFSKKSIDNPYLIFDYFIRVGYIRNLLSVLGYQEKDERYERYEKKVVSRLMPSIDGLCKHSGIFQDRGSRDIMCYATAYIIDFLNYNSKNAKSWGGTIPLFGLEYAAKRGKTKGANKIDIVFGKESLIRQQIAYIPLSISQPLRTDQSLTTYSIYVLLGAIAEILRYRQDASEKMKDCLSQLSQVRTYPMPNFATSNTIDGESGKFFEESDNSKNDNQGLIDAIEKWVKSYPEDRPITPHILGKISTRLFYSLRNIEDNDNSENLGDAMHNRLIILLNSILVEDVREHSTANLGLSNNNPNGKDKIFTDNLGKAIKDTETLSFSRWMLSCPLLLCYLKSEVLESIQEFTSLEKYDPDYSVYGELTNVDVKIAVIKPELAPFRYSKLNISETVEHLKEFISYNDFMSGNMELLKKELKKHFIGNINDHPIEQARKNISDKKIIW